MINHLKQENKWPISQLYKGWQTCKLRINYLVVKWLLWNCRFRLCECTWRLMENVSTWFIKISRPHLDYIQLLIIGMAKDLYILWNNQDFLSRHFYCWIIKPCDEPEEKLWEKKCISLSVKNTKLESNTGKISSTILSWNFFECAPVSLYWQLCRNKHENKSKSAQKADAACVLWVSSVEPRP